MATSKTALVLSGGSIKGSFQAGAVEALLDAGVRPDMAFGISVGALNGAFIADRAGRRKQADGSFDPAAEWPRIGHELTGFWKSRITSFGKIGRKRSKLQLADQILSANFNGVLDMSALYRMIEEEVKREHLLASPLYFQAGAVSMNTGRLHYANAAATNVLDFIIASTAIPVLMPSRFMGSEALVDGGVVDIAPLRKAIDAGAQTIYCVTCMTRNALPVDPSFNPKNFIAFADRLMSLVSYEIIRNDLEHAEELNAVLPVDGTPATSGPNAGKRRVKLVVVEPSGPIPIDLEKFTAVDIARCIELGRAAARSALQLA